MSAEAPQNSRQIAYKIRDLRRQLDRASQQPEGFVRSAGLVCDHSKKMHRLRMIRLCLQNLAVNGLRFAKPARAVKLKSGLQVHGGYVSALRRSGKCIAGAKTRFHPVRLVLRPLLE